MILLDGHSLTVKDFFRPATYAPTLEERGGTASMTVGPDAPALNVGDWVKDDIPPQDGTIWVVRSVELDYQTETRTIQMEHVFSLLKDRIMVGEITPQAMGGSANITPVAAAQYILSYSEDWTFGFFRLLSSISEPYNFNNESLYDALETVIGTIPKPYVYFDLTTYPFKLYVDELGSAGGTAELREGRNLSAIRRSIDRSQMYTHVIGIGKNNIRVERSRNESLYGRKDHIFTDQSISEITLLACAADELLDNHAEPVVTVTVTGLELSRATGEAMDALKPGKNCRVPLPEYGSVIQEKITKVAWKDKVRNPEEVTVTLANSKADITKVVRQLAKSGSRNSKAGAKKGEEDHAWFVDTTTHVAMVAEAVAGEGAASDWSRVAQVLVDGEGVHQRVQRAEGELVTQWSEILATESMISLEVASTQSSLRTYVRQEADRILSAAYAADSDIYTEVSQTASGIRTEIASAQSGLRTYIDATASSLRTMIINSKHVWIQDTDPQGGGVTPTDGDIWIKSTHQGTWDGAEGFDWEHNADYDWNEVQGAQIYGWANNHWELISDQQQVVTMGDVEQTAEHWVARYVRALVNDDGNLSVYRAELRTEADRIRAYVDSVSSGIGSSITETADQIRSEVHAADSQVYSYVEQTATNIRSVVYSKASVYVQWDEPTGTAANPITDGDIWVKTHAQRTWNDMLNFEGGTWNEESDFNWMSMRGAQIYCRKNGEWVLANDETVLAETVDVEETSSQWRATARNLEILNGRLTANEAELRVTATNITSSVDEKIAGVGSRITQTAREIRSEVSASGSQLHSEILQTATNIRLSVDSALSDMGASIEITSGQIYSEVHASASALYSYVDQTATYIRQVVANGDSALQSSITQQANRISLVVEGTGSNAYIKPAAITAAINESGSSSVGISADKVFITGTTKLSGHLEVADGSLKVKTSLIVAGSTTAKQVSINNGTISTPEVSIKSSGKIQFIGSQAGEYYDLTRTKLMNMIASASVSGNTLTLTRCDGTTINFSKAVTLSGDWGSGGTLTVTASPSGVASPFVRTLAKGTPAKSGSENRMLGIPIVAQFGSQGQYTEATNFTAYVSGKAYIGLADFTEVTSKTLGYGEDLEVWAYWPFASRDSDGCLWGDSIHLYGPSKGTPGATLLAVESKDRTPSYPDASAIPNLGQVEPGKRVTFSISGTGIVTKYFYFVTKAAATPSA